MNQDYFRKKYSQVLDHTGLGKFNGRMRNNPDWILWLHGCFVLYDSTSSFTQWIYFFKRLLCTSFDLGVRNTEWLARGFVLKELVMDDCCYGIRSYDVRKSRAPNPAGWFFQLAFSQSMDLHLVFSLLISPKVLFLIDLLQFFFFFSILLSIGCHPRMYSNSVGLPGRLSENMMQLIRLHVKSDPEYYHLSDSIPEKRTTFCDLSLVFQTINRCWGPANLRHCGS